MGVIDDVRKWLNDVPLWKELSTIPDRTAALEKRVADLDEKLNGKWPADVCPKCGQRTMRATGTFGPDDKKNMMQDWLCGDTSCNYHETRIIKSR
jgi:hypothetical protein